MSGQSCATCANWTPPSERTDFGTAVSIRSGVVPFDADASHAAYDAQQEVDKRFGICKAIDLCEVTLGDPVPLATTRDASDYVATLYTQAEFGCAMWAALVAPSRVPGEET